MNRHLMRLLALAAFFVAFGCDKGGYYPFGKRTDIVDSIGANSSVYLHSSADGTEMALFGSRDPLAVIDPATPRPLIIGKVMTDSSTTLYLGTYDLDATGHGTFYVTASYVFTYEPGTPVAGRTGALRYDFATPYESQLTVSAAGAGYRIEFVHAWGETTAFNYTNLDDVMAAVDPTGATGYHDAYQIYNFALFFGQVRVPAFGSIGMTRYITAPGTFSGLVGGYFTVSVASISMPTATLDYHTFEDFPGVWVDGPQATKVNISGDGPMEGVLRFEFRRGGNPTDVILSGTVDYRNIYVSNGIGSSGDYMVTIDGIAGEQPVPVSVASNVTLQNVLPISP